MLKKIMLAVLAAMFVVAPAAADTWTVGQQPVVYPLDRFPTVGKDNGATTWGGTPPYYATMPADVVRPDLDLNDFQINDGAVVALTAAQTGPLGEKKARFTCGTPSHYAYDDPLLFPGQPGVSHLHMFFGNTGTNAFSTWKSLRTTGRSNCPGDAAANPTGYWTPAIIETINGQQFAVRPDLFIVYYSESPIGSPSDTVDPPTDFAYISGPDPMTGYVDVGVAEAQAATAAAIAAGKPMRYTAFNNGFVGWSCENPIGDGTTAYSPNQGAGKRQPYLKTAGGQPTLNCNTKMPDGVTTARIFAEFNGVACWDGVNGHGGPTARGHVRFGVEAKNIQTGEVREACPDTWFKLPHLTLVIRTPFYTMARVSNWRWSSDNNPNYTYRNGETGHIDWFGAWRYAVMQAFMHDCLGTMGNTPRECNYASIGPAMRLLSDSPIPTARSSYRDPPGSLRNGFITDTTHDWVKQGMKGFVPLPKGPHTMHAH